MTAYKCLLFALGAAVVAPATAARAASLSGNDLEVEESETLIQTEESSQEESFLPESSETISVYNNSSVSGNDVVESEYESESEIESDTESGDSDSVLESVYEIMPLQNYNTYYGSITSTYFEYMRGFLSKLGFKDHYVAARVSQYDYIFAYGENLVFNGSFSGSDITVITFNTYNNGSYSSSVQSSFSLSPGSYMVYSDLSGIYPSLATSSDFSLRQIVLVLGIAIVSYTVGCFFIRKAVKSHSRRRRL